MMGERRHPAVFAGLAAAATLALPRAAHAATALESLGEQVASLDPAFVGGYAMGALGGGVACYLVLSHRREREEHELMAEAFRASAAHAAPAPQPDGAREEAVQGRHGRRADDGDIRVQSVEDSRAIQWGTGDYAEVAESYVRKASLRERMATRAKGVADVLAERIGGNEMDGVPVIRRADGSVGDVGVAGWDQVAAQAPAPQAPQVAQVAQVAPAADEPRERRSPAAARSIASRLPEVDEGAFPARRELEDLPSERDVWDVALAALEERSKEPVQLDFGDAVGGLDTLDEPAGLESPTSFIPFRLPAGHPEVVDTESYIDYLISDEFSRNPSHAARSSSESYLTLIEGGSQALPRHAARPARAGRKRPRGAHFARPAGEALEA